MSRYRITEVVRPLTRVKLLKKLGEIGRCSMNFAWGTTRLMQYPEEACGHCSAACARGYRCCGGTHYICRRCVSRR
jgi:hypothetical protein